MVRIKRIFITFFAIIPVIVAIPSLNYLVDPANLFVKGSGIEKSIADLNLAGWNVSVPLIYADYDERIMHSYLIEGFEVSHDTVVFGSSRVRQITHEMFQGNTFYNFASAAANLEDFWAFYSLYKTQGLRPKRIILGLEHWMLDKDPGYTHWKTLAPVYYEIISKQGYEVPENYQQVKTTYTLEKLMQLVSLSYFQESLKRVFASGGKLSGERFSATRDEKARDGEWLQRFDGSAGERLIPRTTEEVRTKVLTEDDGVSPMRAIEQSRVRLFSKLVELIESDGIEVVFFLPPVHPVTFEKWKKNKKGIIAAEEFYRDYAASKGITIIGSYNPSRVNADEKDFMDWVHPRREIVTSIIAELN